MLKFFRIFHTLALIVFCQSVQAKPLVIITKIAPHPSLDTIEKGVIDGLKASGIDARIQVDNAQGNISTAVQLAKKEVGLKPDLIIPITTPSAQTVYQVARTENIPVVFAAVSDPVAAKLVDATTLTGNNITGVSDLSPIQQQVDLIKALQPQARKIGILYNPAEANSVALIDLFKTAASSDKFTVQLFACTSVVELVSVTKRIVGSVDAIYIPNDNTVISGLDVVLKNLKDVPIYTADPESVERGCLASIAMGQYQIGLETGKLAARVLNGESASQIPVFQASQVQVTFNKSAANRLKIKIPESYTKLATLKGD